MMFQFPFINWEDLMADLQKILLIGSAPHLLRSALGESGFTAKAGFEIIEAGDINTAGAELRTNKSIVAVASTDVALHRDIYWLVRDAARPHVASVLVNFVGVSRAPHTLT